MIFRNKTVNEEYLVPVARYLRYRKVIGLLPKKRQIKIVDFGCDPEFSFYNYCLRHGVNIKKYAGIDPLLDESILKENKGREKIILIKSPVEKSNKLKSGSFDFAISLALLEHLKNPTLLIDEGLRLLKKGGVFIFTTPTPFAKPILETLSFQLHLLSPESIADHKNYFTKKSIYKLVEKHNVKFEHNYFDFWVNNLVVLTKKK